MRDSAGQASVDDPVAANLVAVRARIAAAARAVGRDPAEVTLVAVSKAQPDARVLAALAAGSGCSARTTCRKRRRAGRRSSATTRT